MESEGGSLVPFVVYEVLRERDVLCIYLSGVHVEKGLQIGRPRDVEFDLDARRSGTAQQDVPNVNNAGSWGSDNGPGYLQIDDERGDVGLEVVRADNESDLRLVNG